MKINCLYDELVDVSDLKAHPKNRNKHPEDQIKRLADILKYQGWRYPVKVSKQSNYIISGHGRIEAAKLNEWEKVPVNFQDYDSDEQEYADVQADNAIAAWAELDLAGINSDIGDLGPDFDIDLLGIRDFVLEPADKLEPQCDEDEVPENIEPTTKRGDIYQLGRHRLMCGDSTGIDDVEKLLVGARPELCFTSPPYADQREYNGDKELSTEHLATFIRAAFSHVKYFAINLGYSRKNGEVSPYWDDYIKEARECGLKFLSWNIWDKGEAGSIGKQTAMFAIEHEWIFVFGPAPKDLNLTVQNKDAGAKQHGTIRNKDGSTTPIKGANTRKVRDFSQLKTILHQTPQKARNHGIDHPAMFPVEFPEAYIEAMTNFGDAVYEPFTGSGTSLIACEKTGRSCYGMELDPHYCDVIVARWEKYTGKKAEMING
jgi:DNA modification methylase